jgi:hypothetical protein
MLLIAPQGAPRRRLLPARSNRVSSEPVVSVVIIISGVSWPAAVVIIIIGVRYLAAVAIIIDIASACRLIFSGPSANRS